MDKIYIVDFFKRIVRKSNITVLIYLVLNVLIIGAIMSSMMGDGAGAVIGGFFLGIVLYAISLFIALSPVGEWILRKQTGCKKIKRKEKLEFIEPIFREVYAKAKQLDPSISDDIKLYLNDDKCPNAFATGRKTICVTEGLLHMPEEQIKATLAHEFGHLSHKDTDLILCVSVGNMIVSAFILFIRLIIEFVHFILVLCSCVVGGSEGWLALGVTSLYHLAITAVVSGLTWLWTKLGVILVMKASRENEFEADAFSFQCGYGNDLCALLDALPEGGGEKANGLFANLASSHPDTDDRIARMQEMGATYTASYGSGN